MKSSRTSLAIITTLGTILLGLALYTPPVLAQGPRLQLPSCVRDNTLCGVNDILNTIVSAGKFFQAIAGALALALFIYGGTIMLLSGGRAEWVTKGKAALTAAVIGLIIVLGAFVIVRTIESALKGTGGGGSAGGGGPCVCTASGIAAALAPADLLQQVGDSCRAYGPGCAWNEDALTCSCPGASVSIDECARINQQAQEQVAAIPGLSVSCSGGGTGGGATDDAACRALSGGGFEHSCVTLSTAERDRRIGAGECVEGLCPGGRNNVCCVNASGAGGAVAPGELCHTCTCTDRAFVIGSDVPASICLGPLYRNFCSYHPRPGGEPVCER